MLDDSFDAAKHSIGGWLDNGKYIINEGNHIMAAALEYLARTGDSKYVDEFLQTGNWSKKTPNKVLPFKVDATIKLSN